jgi:FtsP/CotA-like multicopper oxidase with cupredoxin domain
VPIGDHTLRLPPTASTRAAVLALLALACVGLVIVVSSGSSASAQATGSGIVCTTGPSFNLETGTGHISTPDGNSILMWSFKPFGGSFQTPGPTLCVTQGQTVTVNLTNRLSEPTSIVFPGQTGVTASGGSAGLLANEAAAGAGTVSYSFVATQPGTYLYESGTNPEKQVEMGLYGAIIVRPSRGADYAYDDASSRFDPDRESLLVLNEIDPDLHRAVELGRTFDPTRRDDDYWTINGRSFPDTISDNSVPWLPNQPYGAMVRVEPYDSATNPLPALIRYANAGLANHPFHPHGNHMRVIARDGRLLRGPAGEDTSFEDFTRTIASGQTYDLMFKWTDVEAWNSSSNPVPVNIPGNQNLVFKDDVTFYSGSPYLGEQDEFPVRVTSYNECGEFYFPWHSHALFEFTNFDEGFGGMATLLRLDPPGGCS